MASDPLNPTIPFNPFLLLVPNATQGTLVLLPTPLAISVPVYRALYSRLHASSAFCTMAFAHHFLPRTWSDAETREVLQTRDVERCWQKRGLGDFALGIVSPDLNMEARTGKALQGSSSGYSAAGRKLVEDKLARIIEGTEYEQLVDGSAGEGRFWDAVTWVGYAGVRDATTTSMPMSEYSASEVAALPRWEEMVELRYGVAPECWGKGIARIAAESVMLWAEKERGVKRFLAETERGNARSGRVLEKMGFVASGTTYWKEDSEVEWERAVV